MKQNGTRKKQIPPDKIAAKKVYSVPIGELQGSKDREMLTQQHAAARPRKARSEREKETPRMGRDALHAPCYTFRCCAAPSIRDRYFYPLAAIQLLKA